MTPPTLDNLKEDLVIQAGDTLTITCRYEEINKNNLNSNIVLFIYLFN